MEVAISKFKLPRHPLKNTEQNTEEEANPNVWQEREHGLNLLKCLTLLSHHDPAEGEMHFPVTVTSGLTYPRPPRDHRRSVAESQYMEFGGPWGVPSLPPAH